MRYRAFISYSSADRALGTRFQRAIERFRIPKPLRGADYGRGATPARLTPLFRDRSDADAGTSLASVLRKALEQSEALVVLCSPASARSPWVNQEIRTFKALGRADRIVSVVVAGEPRRFDMDRAPDGAFPPALFERVGPDGRTAAGEDPEPLAADVRETADGFRGALLKVVAALAGIPLTVLTSRAHEAERRQRRIVQAVALVMSALAVAATVAAFFAWQSEQEALDRTEDAIRIAGNQVEAAATWQEMYGIPLALVRGQLDMAEADFAAFQRHDAGGPSLELERGRLLALFAGLHRAVGSSERELTLARDAVAILDGVRTTRGLWPPSTWLERRPDRARLTEERLLAREALALALSNTDEGLDEAESILEQARARAVQEGRPDFVARFWSLTAHSQYLRGDVDGALRSLDNALAVTGDSPEQQEERLAARSDRAEILLESERHREAVAEQTIVVGELEARRRARPTDAVTLRNLGQALTRQADMIYAASASWTDALPGLERALELLERVHRTDIARMDYARDLSVALERMGDARLQLGETDVAAAHFDRLLDLRRQRVARDQDNDEANRDVAVALERQADAALAKGHPQRALEALDEARDLRGHAVAGAPGDLVAVRDLAVAWWKTALALVAMGRRAAWQEGFETAISLMTPLAELEDAPPGWLRDAAVFHNAYGDALSRIGRVTEARGHWNAALSLVERQLEVSPDDPRLAADREALLSRLRRRAA
jgi:tetratricopeptide (TPR) repeat protein